MNKTSLMLLNDYISLPEHNKLRLARFVQSINPDYALTKSNKDMLLMAISDYQKDITNKTRLAAIESLLKTSVKKVSVKKAKSSIPVIDEEDVLPTPTEADQAEYEINILKNVLGDWTDNNSIAYNLLHGNKSVINILSPVDLDILIGSDYLRHNPNRDYRLHMKHEGWLKKHSGVKPRVMNCTSNVNNTMFDGVTSYTLTDSSIQPGNYMKVMDFATQQEAAIGFDKIVSGPGVEIF